MFSIQLICLVIISAVPEYISAEEDENFEDKCFAVCEQRGQCVGGLYRPKCDCFKQYYTGLTCDEYVDNCEAFNLPVCNRPQTEYCSSFFGSRQCHCKRGYSGATCHVPGMDKPAFQLGVYFDSLVAQTLSETKVWVWVGKLGSAMSVNVNIDGWVKRILKEDFINKSLDLSKEKSTLLQGTTFSLSATQTLLYTYTVNLLRKKRFLVYASAFTESNIPYYHSFEIQVRKSNQFKTECRPNVYLYRHSCSSTSNWIPMFSYNDTLKIGMTIEPDCANYTDTDSSVFTYTLSYRKHVGGMWRVKDFSESTTTTAIGKCKDKPSCTFSAIAEFKGRVSQTLEITAKVSEEPKTPGGRRTVLRRISDGTYRRESDGSETKMTKGYGFARCWLQLDHKPTILGHIKGGINRAHYFGDNLTVQISQKAQNKVRWLCSCVDSAKPCPKPCKEGGPFSTQQQGVLSLNDSLWNEHWEDWIAIEIMYDFLPDIDVRIRFKYFLFREKRPSLEISCLRNCYPNTNYREYTILIGKCTRYCEGDDTLFTNQAWLLDSELVRHPIDLPENILCVRLRDDFDIEDAVISKRVVVAIFRSSSGGWAEFPIFHWTYVEKTPIPFFLQVRSNAEMKLNPCAPQPRMDSQVCLLAHVPKDGFVYYIAYQINHRLYRYDRLHDFAVGVILDWGGSFAFRPTFLANVDSYTRVNVMNSMCFEVVGPYFHHKPTRKIIPGRDPKSQSEKADLLEQAFIGNLTDWHPSTNFSVRIGDISTYVQKISYIVNDFSMMLGETVDEQNYIWTQQIRLIVESLRQMRKLGEFVRMHLDLLQLLSLLNEIIRVQSTPVHPDIINLIGKRYREFTQLHLKNVVPRKDTCMRMPSFFAMHFREAFRQITKLLYFNRNEEFLLDGVSVKIRHLDQDEIPVDLALETGIKERYVLYRDLQRTWPYDKNKYRRGSLSAVRAEMNMLAILAAAILDKKTRVPPPTTTTKPTTTTVATAGTSTVKPRERPKRVSGFNYLPGARFFIPLMGTRTYAFVQVADVDLFRRGIVLGGVEVHSRLDKKATAIICAIQAISSESNPYWWARNAYRVNTVVHVKVSKCSTDSCEPMVMDIGVRYYDLPLNAIMHTNLASYPTQKRPDLVQKFSFICMGEDGHALIQIQQPREVVYINRDVKLVVTVLDKMYVVGRDRPLTIVVAVQKNVSVEGTVTWKKAFLPGIESLPENKVRELGAVVRYGIQVYKIACYKYNVANSIWSPNGTPKRNKVQGFDCQHTTTADDKPDTFSFMARGLRVSFLGSRSIFVDYDVEDEKLLFHILAVILLLWLFMFVAAILLDLTDTIRYKTHFLIDNRPGEEYQYHVIIATGTKWGSGTTSHIGFKIYGTEAQTHRHVLYTTTNSKLLQRGSKDWFLLTTEKWLGRILAIEFWSDHYGNSPDWYCSKVIIRDYGKYKDRGVWVEQAIWVEPELPEETESELAMQLEDDKRKPVNRAKKFVHDLIPKPTPSQIEAKAKKKREKAEAKAEAERLKKEGKNEPETEPESEPEKRLEGGQDEEAPEEEEKPPRPVKRLRHKMKDGRPIPARRLKRTKPSGEPIPAKRLKRTTPEGWPVPTRRNLYRKDGSGVNPNQCTIVVEGWFSLTRYPPISHGVAEYYTRPPLTFWEKLYIPGDLDTRHLWLGAFTKECGALDRKSKVWILLALLVVPMAVIMNHLGTGHLPAVYHKNEYVCHWVYFFSNSNLYHFMPTFEGVWNIITFGGGQQDIIQIEYRKLISAMIVSEVATIILVYPAFYTLRWLHLICPEDDMKCDVSKAVGRVVVISYLLCLTLTCIGFIALFGFTMGRVKTRVVLITYIAYVVISIFIVEMAHIFIRNIYWRILKKKSDEFNLCGELVNMDVESQLCYHTPQHRKKWIPKALYSPLPKMIRSYLRVRERRLMYFKHQFHGIVMFTIFIICFYYVLTQFHCPYCYFSTKVITDIVEGKYTRSMSYKDVLIEKDFWEFMNTTLLHSLHWGAPGWLIMTDMRLVGVPRVRQLRVNYKSGCVMPREIHQLFQYNCYGEFVSYAMDDRNYTPMWRDKAVVAAYLTNRRHMPFKFQPLQDLEETFPIAGQSYTIPGDGYFAKLGRSPINMRVTLNFLSRFYWIHWQTRVIIVEFTVYNPHAKIFNCVKIIYNKRANGLYEKDLWLYTSPLLWTENRNTRHLYLFLYFTIITYLLIVSFIDLMTERGYFKNWWYLLNWPIIYLSYHLFFLLIHRFDITTDTVERIRRTRPNSYINFDPLVHLDYKCRYYASGILFITAIRFWGSIRFDKCFRNVDYTMRYVAKPVGNLLLPLITLMWGMQICFCVIFISISEMGTTLRDSLVATVTLPFGYMTGMVDYNLIIQTGFMGFLFIGVLVILWRWYFYYIYVSIVVRANHLVQVELRKEYPEFTVWDYVNERILNNQGKGPVYRSRGFKMYKDGTLINYFNRN